MGLYILGFKIKTLKFLFEFAEGVNFEGCSPFNVFQSLIKKIVRLNDRLISTKWQFAHKSLICGQYGSGDTVDPGMEY